METPSQTLASKICEQLADQKLIPANGLQKFCAKLANGKLQAEDWRLAVEQAMAGHEAAETKERP